MTIEESSPAPRDAGSKSEEDLATLVRALADRARAADERSAELAERVALLESRRDPLAAEIDPKTFPDPRVDGRARSNRLFIAQGNVGSSARIVSAPWRKDETRRNSIARSLRSFRSLRKVNPNSSSRSQLDVVAGVPEDDPEEALADRVLFLEKQWENHDEEKKIVFNGRDYSLPESTFSLLITHHPFSLPFVFSVVTIALSIACLSLTLASSISNGTRANRMGIPAGVDGTVRAAQFIGAVVGVLMEDEIPQGLQLIANGAGYTLLLNGKKAVQKRVIVCSMLRLIVGYLFLSSLLINIAQNSDVIQIFYDLLALEFVENIDDISFALAKRGFFGRTMLIATNESHNLELSSPRDGRRGSAASITERRLSFSGLIASNNRVNHVVRAVYFLNATILLVGLVIIAATQENGRYRCNTITVLFDEEIWEHAYVRLPDDSIEERLLIYSYFNGLYREDGYHDGYPRYIEQNKNDGTEFGSSVKGAEIVYCEEIGSWVFTHPDILTSPDGAKENECSWLWRSHQTEDYDVLSATDGPWEAWIGEVKSLAFVSITCMECSERSDCNYHGHCGEDKICVCKDSHFGDSCEFELPCQSLATEKALTIDPKEGAFEWKQENPIRVTEHRVYNRPLYVQEGLSGEPFDMRLYKILEKDISSSPSGQPSSPPSFAQLQYMESTLPEDMRLPDSDAPSDAHNPVHSQNEYDMAPDFADWDDFFESPALHDGLEEMLEDFKVVVSYTGSRFYGAIIESNAALGDVFHQDYHAFWSKSFDVDRTFIISDTTFTSSPVGVDFFEMRRRVNSMLNPNIDFSYGPYGALVPLMNYQGTGFFHCLDETLRPSCSPSFSKVPSFSPSSSGMPSSEVPSSSPSASPTGCYLANVNIMHDQDPYEISWTISKISSSKGELLGEKSLVKTSKDVSSEPFTFESQSVCLSEGDYEFDIKDSADNGFSSSASYYTLTVGSVEIVRGGRFGSNETTKFSIPVSPKPPLTPPFDYQAPVPSPSYLRPMRLFHPRQ